MSGRLNHARSAALEFVRRGRRLMGPLLASPQQLEAGLSDVVGRPGLGNPAYRFDEMMDDLLFEVLRGAEIHARVFSEESGWTQLGSKAEYKVICDPFDNSTLSVRGFREAAVAITFATMDDQFICCALGDLVTNRTYYADASGSYVYEDAECVTPPRPTRRRRSAGSLDQAMIVWPGVYREQRRAFVASNLVDVAAAVVNLDGAVFFGRLADGRIDAYIDPFIGQPYYEVPCLELVVRAGGVVTDAAGRPFDLALLIQGLEEDEAGRITVVAAGNAALHDQVMQMLGTAE